MEVNLLKAIRAVKLCDSTPVRQEVFLDIASRSWLIRLVLRVHKSLHQTPLAAFMFAIFAAKSIFKNAFSFSAKNKLLCATDYVNEKKTLASLLYNIEDHFTAITKLQRTIQNILLLNQMLIQPALILRFLRFLKNLEKRNNFLVTCRIAETVCYYMRAIHEIRCSSPQGILVASNYGTCAAALKFAGCSVGLPSIYKFHAIIPFTAEIPPLEMDLAFLYGEKALEAFSVHGPVKCKKVYYCGIPGDSIPMRLDSEKETIKVVGIFLTGLTKAQELYQLAEQLSAWKGMQRVIVRPHPLTIANPDLGPLYRIAKVEIDKNVKAADTAKECDFVVIGNSSVHIEVLKSGTPTIYWDSLDSLGPDYYRLIQDRIVPEIKSFSNFSWRELCKFYDLSWPERFIKIDRAYLRDTAEIHKEIQSQIKELLNSRSL